ncbi:8097_t:CDS:1, partial [Gigaspora rosea]
NIGKLEIQKSCNGISKEINIARVDLISNMKNVFPEIIPAYNISLERQWYLYEEIRQHIQDPSKRDKYSSKPNPSKPKKAKTSLQSTSN